eukprot:scaffold134716_cov31-Tisochrysis_lutea.AAC.1
MRLAQLQHQTVHQRALHCSRERHGRELARVATNNCASGQHPERNERFGLTRLRGLVQHQPRHVTTQLTDDVRACNATSAEYKSRGQQQLVGGACLDCCCSHCCGCLKHR